LRDRCKPSAPPALSGAGCAAPQHKTPKRKLIAQQYFDTQSLSRYQIPFRTPTQFFVKNISRIQKFGYFLKRLFFCKQVKTENFSMDYIKIQAAGFGSGGLFADIKMHCHGRFAASR
jgi:hypothetical protein